MCDEIGTECIDCQNERRKCQVLLPAVVNERLAGEELLVITCDVRDDMDNAVYRGRLAFEGIRNPTSGARTP